MGDVVLSYGTELLTEDAFPVPDDARYTVRLFHSDGTAQGTYSLLPENRSFYAWIPATDEMTYHLPDPTDGEAFPYTLWPGDDEMFVFFWNRSDVSITLWRSDGTADGFTRLADLGEIGTEGFRVVGFGGGRLYFTVKRRPEPFEDLIPELWTSDGTPEGTYSIPTPPEAQRHNETWFGALWVSGGRLYYFLDDGVHGNEPWVSDGTVDGTHLVEDSCPGPCDTRLRHFTRLGDEILLSFDDGDHPLEPQIYTPETGAFRSLGDLCPGECVANAWVLAQTDDLAFLGTEDGVHGYELWAAAVPGSNVPPPEEPLTSPELPGFEVWVRITAGPIETGAPIDGHAEARCLPETLCVSGAVAGRSEVFVRVVGPKPNGHLWPTLVKFTTSTVDVWLRQVATGQLRHYRLDGATPGSSELNGLFDREGFLPE